MACPGSRSGFTLLFEPLALAPPLVLAPPLGLAPSLVLAPVKVMPAVPRPMGEHPSRLWPVTHLHVHEAGAEVSKLRDLEPI